MLRNPLQESDDFPGGSVWLIGAASVLDGQSALGGAVNGIMRAPNPRKTEIDGEIGYGSQNSAHAAAGVGGPVGHQLFYRFDASYRRSDGYVDRDGSHGIALSGAVRDSGYGQLNGCCGMSAVGSHGN